MTSRLIWFIATLRLVFYPLLFSQLGDCLQSNCCLCTLLKWVYLTAEQSHTFNSRGEWILIHANLWCFFLRCATFGVTDMLENKVRKEWKAAWRPVSRWFSFYIFQTRLNNVWVLLERRQSGIFGWNDKGSQVLLMEATASLRLMAWC